MFVIKSFKANSMNLPLLQEWIDELKIDNNIISKLKLKLLVNEAFINACEQVADASSEIIIIIKNLPFDVGLAIFVTDQGKGFNIEGLYGDFAHQMIGKQYLISKHPDLNLYATPEKPNKLIFESSSNVTMANPLPTRSRGLLSMLNAADKVEYFYGNNTSNYLKISLFNKSNHENV